MKIALLKNILIKIMIKTTFFCYLIFIAKAAAKHSDALGTAIGGGIGSAVIVIVVVVIIVVLIRR